MASSSKAPAPAGADEARANSAAAAADAPNADEAASRAVGIDWAGLAYDLGLAGLGQEIVANSSLESWADGCLRLALLPEIYELASGAIEAEIRQALERKLGVSLRLELGRRDSLAGETPLQAKLRRQEQERQAAIESLRQDSTVRKLTRAFAAELDEDSVVRIENQSN